MNFENGQIQVFFGPPAHNAPDDLRKVIVDFIDEAEESLEVAVQELEDPEIAAALERASRRKKKSRPEQRISVNVIVESSYLREKKPQPVGKKTNGGEFRENRRFMNKLLESAVHFKLDFNPSTFHHKFIIRDFNKPKAALLSGSTNFTATGTGRNLNNVVVFHNEDIVKAYRNEWNQLNQGIFGRHSPRTNGHRPKECMIGESKVYPLFAPDQNPELILINAILKAEKSIHFAIFTFSGSSTIDDAIISALKKDVSVLGVLDRMQSSHVYSPHPGLRDAGATLRRHRVPKIPGDDKPGKLHHKMMVIDENVVITGSLNYTDKANRFNDENLFFIHNEEIAKYFVKEIERMYEDLAQDF